MLIPRRRALQRIEETFHLHPVAAVLGPRQCGKTTLARVASEGEPTSYFDLENPELARSLGTSENTARRYLDILAGAFMVRVLPPWFENIGKRQVKAPKIYLRDSGLLHALLGLSAMAQLQGHPKLGASWEGFALEQVIGALETRDAYYWATHGGAELDLMVMKGGKRYGFEFKYVDAPGPTRSMRIAIEDLRLEKIWVVYPGRELYEIDSAIAALPIERVRELVL